MVLLAERFHIPSPPKTLVWSLFFLAPVVALLICEWVVWSCSRTVARKLACMSLTALAMLLQFGIILAILRAILVTRIGYVQ